MQLGMIRLAEMHQNHRGLTEAIAAGYGQAASVCLSRHHTSPIALALLYDPNETSAQLAWEVPDLRILGAWANTTDTTEAGAYGCVIAAVELLRGFYAVRRAETGTGADYYIGPLGSGLDDLEDCLRLEISGVGGGDFEEVRRRLAKKVEQARQGDSNLPAMAGVIGFAAKLLMLEEVAEDF